MGHLPAQPNCSQHRTIHDQGRSGGGMGEPLWFVAYSRALQRVGEAAHGWKWKWPVGKTPEVRVSPLVHAFWEETGIDLTVACIKLCWEPAPRGIFRKREEGPVAYVITFMDEFAIWVPSLDAWDQFVWPPATGPHRGRAVWLLLQSGCKPWACNASGAVKGDRQSGDLLVCGTGPSV